MLGNKQITIFGGTGSIGTLLTEVFLKLRDIPSKIQLFSNNEFELWESKNHFANLPTAHDFLSFIFGDIRDLSSVKKAVKDSNIVINAAAMKHVGFCEETPYDAVKTNIIGLQNIIEACQTNHVKQFLQISTDKAVDPVSVMGATKLIGERMTLHANDYRSGFLTNVVRFGNVKGSRGSLIPQISKYLERGDRIFVSDPGMMRFFLTKEQVGDFVLKVLAHSEDSRGRLIYIPKMEEVAIMDVIGATCLDLGVENPQYLFYGKGLAEKMRETLISQSEMNILHEIDDMYIIGGLL